MISAWIIKNSSKQRFSRKDCGVAIKTQPIKLSMPLGDFCLDKYRLKKPYRFLKSARFLFLNNNLSASGSAERFVHPYFGVTLEFGVISLITTSKPHSESFFSCPLYIPNKTSLTLARVEYTVPGVFTFWDLSIPRLRPAC